MAKIIINFYRYVIVLFAGAATLSFGMRQDVNILKGKKLSEGVTFKQQEYPVLDASFFYEKASKNSTVRQHYECLLPFDSDVNVDVSFCEKGDKKRSLGNWKNGLEKFFANIDKRKASCSFLDKDPSLCGRVLSDPDGDGFDNDDLFEQLNSLEALDVCAKKLEGLFRACLFCSCTKLFGSTRVGCKESIESRAKKLAGAIREDFDVSAEFFDATLIECLCGSCKRLAREINGEAE